MKKYFFFILLFLSSFFAKGQNFNSSATQAQPSLEDLFSYGVKWDESSSTPGKPAILRVGNPQLAISLPVQNKMRRCVVRDDFSVNYYLNPTNSWNKAEVAPYVTAKNPSSISGGPNSIISTGSFADTTLKVGMAVKNVTQGTYAIITTIHNSDSVSISIPMPSTDRTWGTADGTTSGHLIHSGINYSSLGVVNGDVVFNQTDNTYAIVTNVATGDLTINANIMASGEKYLIIKRFIETTDVFEICTARLTGADGQVMVEYAKYYFKYKKVGTVHEWRISEIPLPGFEIYPAFIVGGVTKETRLFGAYEGYLNSTKLESSAGFLATTNKTRAQYRGYAVARATGWHQESYLERSALQLLYLVEYASWYSQSVIGAGASDWASATWNSYNAYNPVNYTGISNAKGNATFNVSNGDGKRNSFMTYRGVENFFGYLWKFCDGINIYAQKVYICNTPSSFADDTKTGYLNIGITLPATNGYQSTLAGTKYGFLPSAVTGDFNTYITDYYWQSTGWRVLLSGGCLYFGALGGLAAFDANGDSSGALGKFGSRLCGN
jgi:hypothetical protein